MESIHIYPHSFVKNNNSFIEDFFKNNDFNFINSYNMSDYKATKNDFQDNYIHIFNVKDISELKEKFIEKIFFLSEKEKDYYIQNIILFNSDFIIIKNRFTTSTIDLSELESITFSDKSEEKENFNRIQIEFKNKNNNRQNLFFTIAQNFIINDKKVELTYNSVKLIEYINFNFFKYLHKFKKSNSQKKNI